jgi:VCBS repeat-containing protein
VAWEDGYGTDEDITLTVEAPGVLGNDSDADGDALTAVLDTDVSHGVLTLHEDGSFTYVPGADFNGTDEFRYVANDGLASSAVATVTLTVAPVNDAPVADAGGPYAGTAGEAVTFDGSGSSDVDGTIASYAWDFGDGTAGAGVAPAHTYAAGGTYTVTLLVTDDSGETSGPSTTTATISTPPPLVVSPSTLMFEAQKGADPIPNRKSFTVTNTTSAPIRWRADEDATWLSVQSPTGVLGPGESEAVSVTVVGVGSLPPGTLHTVIVVTDRDREGVQATVTVVVTVLADPASTQTLRPTSPERR